jgi:serine/threonine-protein kinase
VLPRAVIEFSRKSDDPSANPLELAQIIETDAGLTCDLLRHVNSSCFALRSRAVSVQHAISMLGIRNTRLALVSTGMKRMMKAGESKLINLQEFWATNLERALLAREVAILLNVDGELAYAASILQDFLLPAVTNQLFPAYWRFATGQSQTPKDLVQFEKDEFGWTHAEAAAGIMLGWGFPDDLVCCVCLHHEGLGILKHPILKQTAAAAVCVATLMPDSLEQVPNGIAQLRRLEQAWPAFRLDGIATRVHQQLQSLALADRGRPSFLQRSQSMFVDVN